MSFCMGLLPYNQNNTVCRTQFFAPCQYYTGIHTFARFSPCIMLDVVISSMMVWRILSSSKPPSISRHNAHTRLPAEAWKYMNQGKEWLWCSICFQLPMISLGLIKIVLMFTPFEFEAVQDRCVNNCCLSINALHTCVYIYIWQLSSFRAPKLWFIDLTVTTCHIQYTFLSLCQFISQENRQNMKILEVRHFLGCWQYCKCAKH